MASASKLEMVCRTLRGVLLSEKGGVAIHRLQGDFRELTGTPLQFKEFGYPSLEAFLRSIPHVVSLQRGPDGGVLCKCVTDDTTQHIGSLVSRQKGKKKKGSGMKTHPGKPRGSPYRPKPFYGNYNPSRKPQPVTPKFRTKKPNPKFYKPATQQPRFHIPRPTVSPPSGPPKPTSQKTAPVNHYQSRTRTESTKSLASTYRSSANASATAVQQPTGTWSKTAPVNNLQSTKQTETTKRLGSASTSSANASATAVQQPTPGPWSGKLGSRRNQQSGTSTPVDAKRNQPKPDPPTTQPTVTQPKVYENIYITVENDGATKGKAKSAKPKVERSASLESAKAKKPEWSANYEVPPRFKKLMSPTGTTFPDHQDAGPDRTQDTTFDPPVKARPQQVAPSTPPIRGKTSDWIQKALEEKANGIWASGLSDMHKKEFGSSLDATIIDQMAEQNLLQKEMVLNNIILYPKLTVSIKNSSESKVSKRTVNLGARDQKEVGTAAEKTGNQTAQRNGTPTGPSTVVQPINNTRWKPSDDWVVQQNPRLTPTANAPPTNNGTSATSPTNIVPSNLSSPRTVSPGAQLLGNPTLGNASLPADPLPRNGSPQDPAQAESDASNINEITNSLANAQLSGTHSPPCVPVEETRSEPSEPSEPSEGGGSPTMEVSGVPNLQLPEEDEWDVYVAYIKSLSDFFVILIGDDYSEQLMVLEEEMRLFYQCSTWTLTDPPEEGDCCAAQFNREWLRVMVKSVQGDQVECFLLDHGDIETVGISFLKPLSDTFLQLPFQVVRCKLAGSEQVAKDDDTALQMFCQLALGKNLLAEITSRDGEQVTMELFDESDVSILEQSMAAGI